MPQFSRKYSVSKGLISSVAPTETTPSGFIQLVNCFVDRRLGAVIKRGGSTSESLGASVNSPLGLGIYKDSTASLLMPMNIIFLAFFTGPVFRKKSSGTWSAVTLHSNTSFSTTKQMMFAQIGTTMIMCSGRPARWDSSASQIERVGYPAPVTAATLAVGAATGPTGTYTYIFTYYNSTTGKESDWSPVSASITVANQKVTVTLPTVSSGSTADKKRLYRIQNAGSEYFFVADVNIATATYTDSTLDASLGVQAPNVGDNGLPPDSAFIVKAHNSRIFIVDASDPYKLTYSQGYTGNANLLEYFSAGSAITFSHEITGLWSNPGSLLVFGVRNISVLSGASEDDFNVQNLYEGVGTLFGHSICSNGEHTVFLSENGFKSISNRGLESISLEIDDELRSLLNNPYGNFVYTSTTWNPALNQFLFSFSASTANATPWVLSASGSVASWELSATSVTEEWDIPGAATGVADLTRVKVWGWNPDVRVWTEYQFDQITDFNTGRYSVNFLVTPYPSSVTLEPQQEASFFGIDLGTNNGKIVLGWDASVGKDDSTNVSATAITGRIQPVVNGETEDNASLKFFRFLIFDNDYEDPTVQGGTVEYILDFDDAYKRDYTNYLYSFDGDGDKKRFTKAKGRFFHLKIMDSTDTSDKLLLQSFHVVWTQTAAKETR